MSAVFVKRDTFDNSGKKRIGGQSRLEGKEPLSRRQFGKQDAFIGMSRRQEKARGMNIKRRNWGRGQHNSFWFASGAGLAHQHRAVIESRSEPAAIRRPRERRDGGAAEAAGGPLGGNFINPHC